MRPRAACVSPSPPAIQGLSLNYNAANHAFEGYLPGGGYDLRIVSQGQEPLCATAHIHVSGAAVLAGAVTLHPIPEVPVVVDRQFTQSQGDAQDLNRGGYFFTLQAQDPGGYTVVGNQTRGINAPPPASSFVRASSGTYHFIINAGGGYVASVNSGGVDLMQSPLVIDDDVAPAPIYVILRDDYATLTGRIRQPSPPATQSANSPATQSAYTNLAIFVTAIPLDRPESQANNLFGVSNDRFTLPNLAPGHYLILASHDQQSLFNLEYRNPDVLRDLTTQGATVTLSPGQKDDIEVPLMGGPSAAQPMGVTQ